MNYQLSFRLIGQKFIHPVVTHYGIWEIRESIILRLVDGQGRIGWGEISPISWFGSETLEQALDFCQQFPGEITTKQILTIPDKLPACQFGFESALTDLEQNAELDYTDLSYSGLLPTGVQALHQWKNLWNQGYRTFKWKIGVDAIARELGIFESLINELPDSAKLRLDANGGLTREQAETWLKTCEEIPDKIEFLEQPLGKSELKQMMELSQSYSTTIALDESVATLRDLEDCFQKGWRGVFVIKPGIAGSLYRLKKFCQNHEIDTVFSSVFETAIGRKAALELAIAISKHQSRQRAVGFGINLFLTPHKTLLPTNLGNDLFLFS